MYIYYVHTAQKGLINEYWPSKGKKNVQCMRLGVSASAPSGSLDHHLSIILYVISSKEFLECIVRAVGEWE